MQDSDYTISVLISCYDEGKLLFETIESLDSQTDRDFEIIIVNDASKNKETIDACKRLEKRDRTRVIWQKENGGPGMARRAAFRHMGGRIAVPLDGDDRLPATAIADIRKTFIENPNADFVYGDYIRHERLSGERYTVSCQELSDDYGWLKPRTLIKSWKLLGTSPCKREMYDLIKGGDARFSRDLHDIDVLMKAMIHGCKGKYIGKVIYEWHRSASGISVSVKKGRLADVYCANIQFFIRFFDVNQCIIKMISLRCWSELRKFALKNFHSQEGFNIRMLFYILSPSFLIKWIYHSSIPLSLNSRKGNNLMNNMMYLLLKKR